MRDTGFLSPESGVLCVYEEKFFMSFRDYYLVKMDNQIQQTNDDEKQATLWNQHEICPECKSSNINEIDYLFM